MPTGQPRWIAYVSLPARSLTTFLLAQVSAVPLRPPSVTYPVAFESAGPAWPGGHKTAKLRWLGAGVDREVACVRYLMEAENPDVRREQEEEEVMKHRHEFGTAFGAVLSVLILAQAATAVMVVDPDMFAVGTDISSAFSGVTLSSVGAGFDGDYDSRIFSVNPTGWGEPYSASTGSLVFGTNDSTFPHLFGGYGDAKLRIDFSSYVTWVSLDAIGNDDSDWAGLESFDALGNPIASYLTGELGVSGVESMVVSGSSISYVIASGISGDSVGFDNLKIESAVPAPGAILLGSFGAGLVGWLRRRSMK